MMHRVTLPGNRTVNVSQRGSGPAVVLLHGFPDSLELWNATGDRLVAAGRTVVAFDQYGFGDSDAPPGRRHYRIDALVDDVANVVRMLDLPTPVDLMGHDWGAVIGWCVCLRYPELVRRHVAISVGHPRAYRSGGWEQKRKGLYTIGFQFAGIAERRLLRRNGSGLRRWARTHPDADAMVAAMARPGRLTAGLNWYRANIFTVFTRRWADCRVPTLGVCSDGDHLLAEDQMRRSANYMAAPWQYLQIPGAGHWIPTERPAELARSALDWFDAV
ncbi:MAG TPA: alpha/beta fold hydrolase [Mycobacterium sp.]|nr:alpha/beta fold hydrolase [Mycobacterium sp.]